MPKLERLDFVPFDLIDEQQNNPNEMSDAEFNLLYDNMERVGFVDPMFLRRKPDGRYSLIGGHHRKAVAVLQGLTGGPGTVIDDPEFDDDQEKFQVVRMNMIKGKINPAKFVKMYSELNTKYSQDILRESFGFADQEEFARLIAQVKTNLPKEFQKEFQKAAKDIKTIDGLTAVLNQMFSKYGSTLDYGYMVLDYGGKDSIWLRIDKSTYSAALELGEICRQKNRTMDALLGGVLQLIAQGKLDQQLEQIVQSTPEVKISEAAQELPTEDFLAKLESGNGA